MALFVLNVPWLVVTDDRYGALDLILRKCHLFLIPFGLMISTRKVSEKALHVILGLFLVGCLISSFICLAVAVFNVIGHQSFVDHSMDPPGYYFLYYSLTQPVNIPPVYLSLFCNFAVLIAFHSPFIHSQAKRFVAVYLGLFIIMVFSAVGIATFAVMTLLVVARSRYKNLTALVLTGILITGIAVYIYSWPFLRQQFTPDFNEKHGDLVMTMPSKLAIWTHAWEAIVQNPLIGYGVGEGQKALEEIYEKENFEWGIEESLNPHNEFISIFLDLGVVGFCVLFGGLIYSLVLALRMKDNLSICFIILIFFFFCFESVLFRQKGIVFFSIFYALLFSNLANKKNLSKI